jgi:hypothetical protein
MTGRAILVSGENPSLASALADLFLADDLPLSVVRSLDELVGPEGDRSSPEASVVVLASRGYRSPTAREWATGRWPDSDLVVVGSRDPGLRSRGRFHVVPLPLVPAELLSMVRWLLRREAHPVGA